MCGFIGYVSFDGSKIDPSTLSRMNATQNLRGPDESGLTVLNHGQIGLAHTRLSIIDLSPKASQPMSTEDQKHWIVFNGEIYNYLILRRILSQKGVCFQSDSDTESLLLALRQWGPAALNKIEGMFAFVYIDLEKKYTLAARDRIGIKPVCYFDSPQMLCFASTIAPLKLLPQFDAAIDPIARFEMLTSKYVTAPRSIYRKIKKLLPGTYYWADFSGKREVDQYWSPKTYLFLANNTPKPEKNWISQLQNAVHASVKRQLVADVPVGIFLSGGIDSSLVASVASRYHHHIDTFTIGYRGRSIRNYDESDDASQTSVILGTKHHTLYVSPQDVIENLKHISRVYDEPFGDPSAVPTFLISRFARQKVKVVLSGDGGDEQFFGYSRFHILNQLYPILKYRPLWLKAFLKKKTKVHPRSIQARLLSGLLAFKDDANLYTHYFQENYAGLAALAGAGSLEDLWQCGLAQKNEKGYLMAVGSKHAFANGMMLADLLTFLPDDCLTKVDRASMANSLEARVPLLDESVLKLSLSMPFLLKWRHTKGKYILKKVLSRYLPANFIERPKKGFGVPLDKWLRNELKPFAQELLSSANLIKADLDPAGVNKIMAHHLQKRYDHQYTIWPICCYVNWYLNEI